MDTKEELISLKPLTYKIELQPASDVKLLNNNNDSSINYTKKIWFKTNGRLLQILATIFGALATFTTGQLMGWVSPSIPVLQSENSPIPGGITNAEGSWLASMVMVGNMVAVPWVALTVDFIGRKLAVLLSAIPVFISWVLIYYAKTIEMLYVARFIAGIGETYGKATMFMYIGEIADARIRGALGSLLVCTLNLGILYEYAIGPYVSYEDLAWISGLIPLLLLVTFVWMPESPYYYVIRHKFARARAVLVQLRGTDDVDNELHDIRGMIEERLGYKEGFKELFGNPINLKCFLLMCGCFFAQELSGITPNIMYAKKILEDSHLGGIPPEIAPAFIPFLKIIATLMTMVLVDKAGRRPLFMISTSTCAFAMAIMSAFYYSKYHTDLDLTYFQWIPLTMMLFFNVMFIFGLGCLPFVMIGELFPANIKAIAVCFTALCGPLSSVVATKMFQILSDHFGGVHAAFGAYSVCCLISFVFVTMFLPETKNRTLAEIQQSLKK